MQTEEQLRTHRDYLIWHSGMSYEDLRDAAQTWSLPAWLMDVWYTVEGINYLLGESE